MNFGTNLFTWFQGNMEGVTYIGLIVIGLFLLFKREFSKLIGFAIIAIIAVTLIFDPAGVKDLFLNISDTVFR